MLKIEAIEFAMRHADWMTVVIMVAVVLIWTVWRSAGGFLEQKSFEVLHGSNRRSLYAGNTVNELRVALVLIAVYLLMVALFIYHLVVYFEIAQGFTCYLQIIGLLVGYHGIKILLVKYWHYLVSDHATALTWLKSYQVFNLLFGLLLFPITVLITYSHQIGVEIGLNIGLFLFVIYLIVLLVRSIDIFFDNLSSFVYVILYFCSLEILPFLLIVKLVL